MQLIPKTIAQFIGRMVIFSTQLFVVAVLVWRVLRVYPGDQWLPVRLGSYFAPWLLLGLIPALGIALLKRRQWLAGASLAAILLTGSHYAPQILPRIATAGAHSETGTLRVMTFNVHYQNRNAAEIAALIRAEKPDIIALQEATGELRAALLPELNDAYPYHSATQNQRFSVLLVSRFPFKIHAGPENAGRLLHTTVKTPAGPVTVLNVHLPTAIRQRGWLAQKNTLTAITGHLTQISGPVIVMGDFNTTDYAENYQIIAKRLTNARKVTGPGFGFTFPDSGVIQGKSGVGRLVKLLLSLGPVVGIDHIFISPHFTPLETRIIPTGLGSDHLPVMAVLKSTGSE